MSQQVWLYFTPRGPSARLFIACYMLVTGAARIITGNNPQGDVNVFSSRAYGIMLVLSGAFLFVTLISRFRLRWSGRIAAIIAAVLWLLVIAQAWSAGAWVSISGAFVFVAALVNEVRTDDG